MLCDDGVGEPRMKEMVGLGGKLSWHDDSAALGCGRVLERVDCCSLLEKWSFTLLPLLPSSCLGMTSS